MGTGSAISLEQCWDAMNSGENRYKRGSMMKVDGERTRGESGRESERERERERSREGERDSDRGRTR